VRTKKVSAFIVIVVLLLSMLGALCMPVPTRQGINYKVRTYYIPFYIKMIEFIDRDYHYKRLVKEITHNARDDEDKVLRIFHWCTENVAHQPDGLPVVDDHPLHIIIRGYGGGDQLEDIFTILCVYAGYEACYQAFHDKEGKAFFVSFVKIGSAWYAFSAYHNMYVMRNNRLVSIRELLDDPNLIEPFVRAVLYFDSEAFMKQLRTADFDQLRMRTQGQNPFRRLRYYITNSTRR
jgi:hypothetical protein